MTAGRVRFQQTRVCSTWRCSYMTPINRSANRFPSPRIQTLQLLENSLLGFLSFTKTVYLIPKYKIIGNPTTFSCKTLPPRRTVFNSLLLAPMGEGGRQKEAKGKWAGKREGGREEVCLLENFLQGWILRDPTSSWTSIFSIWPGLTLPDWNVICFCSILEAIRFHSRWYQPAGSVINVVITHSSRRLPVYLGVFGHKHLCLLYKKG